MIPSPALLALNHLLAGSAWARERLREHAGRRALISLPPLELKFEIDSEGYFVATDGEPEVTLSLPAAALSQLPKGMEALVKEAHVSGPADFADTLGFVLKNLRWDAEEDLSKLLGDVAAHRLTEMGRRFFEWQKQAASNALENVGEYLTEEQSLAVTRRELDAFAEQNRALREKLEKLEARVKVLR